MIALSRVCCKKYVAIGGRTTSLKNTRTLLCPSSVYTTEEGYRSVLKDTGVFESFDRLIIVLLDKSVTTTLYFCALSINNPICGSLHTLHCHALLCIHIYMYIYSIYTYILYILCMYMYYIYSIYTHISQ